MSDVAFVVHDLREEIIAASDWPDEEDDGDEEEEEEEEEEDEEESTALFKAPISSKTLSSSCIFLI